jgi:hypothetical protein
VKNLEIVCRKYILFATALLEMGKTRSGKNYCASLKQSSLAQAVLVTPSPKLLMFQTPASSTEQVSSACIECSSEYKGINLSQFEYSVEDGCPLPSSSFGGWQLCLPTSQHAVKFNVGSNLQHAVQRNPVNFVPFAQSKYGIGTSESLPPRGFLRTKHSLEPTVYNIADDCLESEHSSCQDEDALNDTYNCHSH